jgi:hypothetical protein
MGPLKKAFLIKIENAIQHTNTAADMAKYSRNRRCG